MDRLRTSYNEELNQKGQIHKMDLDRRESELESLLKRNKDLKSNNEKFKNKVMDESNKAHAAALAAQDNTLVEINKFTNKLQKELNEKTKKIKGENIRLTEINAEVQPLKEMLDKFTSEATVCLENPEPINNSNDIVRDYTKCRDTISNLIDSFRTRNIDLENYLKQIKGQLPRNYGVSKRMSGKFLSKQEVKELLESHLQQYGNTQEIKEIKEKLENMDKKERSIQDEDRKKRERDEKLRNIEDVNEEINIEIDKKSTEFKDVTTEDKTFILSNDKKIITQNETINFMAQEQKNSGRYIGSPIYSGGASNDTYNFKKLDSLSEEINKFDDLSQSYQNRVVDILKDREENEEMLQHVQEFAESSADQLYNLTNLNLLHQVADKNLILYFLGRRMDKDNFVRYYRQYNILARATDEEVEYLKKIGKMKEDGEGKNRLERFINKLKTFIDKFVLDASYKGKSYDIPQPGDNIPPPIAIYNSETNEDEPLAGEEYSEFVINKINSKINEIMGIYKNK